MSDEKEEKRRKKMHKKMRKILLQAWEHEGSDPFKETGNPSLQDVGRRVEDEAYYHATNHRSGWEEFARDLGLVYAHHISRSTKHSKAAKEHLKHIQEVLGHTHESLSAIAGKPNVKRKKDTNHDGASPDKKRRRGAAGGYKSNNANPELAEREVRAMDMLHQFIHEKGGNPDKLLKGFRSRVTRKSNQSNKYDVHFFNPSNQRFRSMLEVGRHLDLVHDESAKAAALKKGNRKQQSSKEQQAEKKRIRRELDKLRKTLQRATKSLEDHVAAHEEEQADEDGAELASDASTKKTTITRSHCAATRTCDIDGFPGIPADCIPDVLQAWDFCATFGRVLSLSPMESVDDFQAALAYVTPSATEGDDVRVPPVYVAETHLALLKLLLDDRTSEDWWWSVVENDLEVAAAGPGMVEEKPLPDGSSPVYRIQDVHAMLHFPEDNLVTSSWMQCMKGLSTANKADVKTALLAALKVVANPWVKLYLRKAVKAIVRRGLVFTKQAIAWLVRLYQPLLRASPNELDAAKAKAIANAGAQMAQLNDKAPSISAEEVAELDIEEEEDEEDDDEESDEDDEEEADPTPSKDGGTLEASPIPPRPLPTLVDLLLPPEKPKANDAYINAFTWPQVTGATVHRILHRKKRILNEVDDALRLNRERDPLTLPERREREAAAASRVLTECASISDEQIEKAIAHLCEGKPYLDLSFVERLCILRLLIEAAYDSDRLHDVVDKNYKDRTSAMKSLEVEQRKAKKEAKEKAAADEVAARQKLADEAKESFLDEKRDEIRKLNENSHELTDDVIDALTEAEIIEFDEDYKADYEALPTPDSFNKGEVAQMVSRMHEEAAFETDALRVLTLDEVVDRDRRELDELESQLNAYGGEDAANDLSLDRGTHRAIDRLKKDIEKTKQNAERLPVIRERAMEGLRDAIADGTMKVLRAAMTAAKRAKLTGADDETGGIWAVDLLRDAALELEKAKQNKKVFDAQKELVAKRNKCFIRTEPLGRDRYGNRFWTFDNGEDGHVWIDAEYTIKSPDQMETDDNTVPPGFVAMEKTLAEIVVGAKDMEEDFIDEVTEKAEFEQFSRKEYHSTGASPSLVKNHWGCQATEESLRDVIKHLDSKNPRERELKSQLKETVENKAGAGEKVELTSNAKAETEDDVDEKNQEDGEAANVTEAIPDEKTDGDEQWLQKAKAANQNHADAQFDGFESLHSAIGRKVRVRDEVSRTKDTVLATYETGTVVAWKLIQEDRKLESEEDSDDDEIDFGPKIERVDVAQWKVITNRGHQYWLNGTNLLESISRHVKLESGIAYYEHDAAFLGYRNALGKYLGKASEAPLASSPIFFARLMIRRENELYPKLKIRSYDNSWGGKSGQRALWTNSMKDFAFDFATVQQGLLTLENAFFDLTLEWSEYENIDATEEPDAKEILANPATRNEIELESIDKSIPGLWNSPATRAIFIDIVSNSKTTGVLALALDLLCRNTMNYLRKHKLDNVRTQSYTDEYLPPRAARRRNAWQQANYDDWF